MPYFLGIDTIIELNKALDTTLSFGSQISRLLVF